MTSHADETLADLYRRIRSVESEAKTVLEVVRSVGDEETTTRVEDLFSWARKCPGKRSTTAFPSSSDSPRSFRLAQESFRNTGPGEGGGPDPAKRFSRAPEDG